MCRMIMFLGMDKETVRSAWISWGYGNRDGWGFIFSKKWGWEKDYDYYTIKEWRTLNSDVPIDLRYLDEKVWGLLHFRLATIGGEFGGVHPFRVKDDIYIAHNGVIHSIGEEDYNVDSEIIVEIFRDKLIKYKKFEDAFIDMINELGEFREYGIYSGYWNLMAIDFRTQKFGIYCDGDIVRVRSNKKIVGYASDEYPIKRKYRYDILRAGDYEVGRYYYDGVVDITESGKVKFVRRYPKYSYWDIYDYEEDDDWDKFAKAYANSVKRGVE